MDKYQIIYADPPWHFNYNIDKAVKGIVTDNGQKGMNLNSYYSTMTIQEIKDLSIDPYQIVYSDPPWSFPKSSRNLVKGGFNKSMKNFNVEKVYPTLSNEDIAALPIKDIIAEDAACFMWTTDAHLPQAIEIMKAWGFTYKTIGFVWVKKEKSGKQVKMLAPWTNKGAELCLFGTKGAMTKHLGANDVFQVHEAQRREHSRKPDIIRDEIKRMFPDCKRLELFARTAMPGWDAWGNEVDKFTEPEETKKGLW
jgi:site-specific DNA-methyltransferase (adenine-specific)